MLLGPVGIVHRQDQSLHQGAGVAPKDTARPARGQLVHRTDSSNPASLAGDRPPLSTITPARVMSAVLILGHAPTRRTASARNEQSLQGADCPPREVAPPAGGLQAQLPLGAAIGTSRED